MATYSECSSLLTDPAHQDFRDKIKFACIVAADGIRLESLDVQNAAARKRWAALVLRDPVGQSIPAVAAVVAQNRAFTLAQITGASDAAIQSAVNDVVTLIATAGN